MVALVGFVLFHFLTYAWPFYSQKVDTEVGCNATRFDWCENLTAVNMWLFYISYALVIGLSFPLLQITSNTLFSEILGPRLQGFKLSSLMIYSFHLGTQQGLLQVAAGAARIVGPISGSVFYTKWGPRPVWLMEICTITLVLSSWFIFYKRMVPLRVPSVFWESARRRSVVDKEIQQSIRKSCPA